MVQLDKYKQAIIQEYCQTNKNIFVNATAGSGKTFVLCELAKITPPIKSSVFLAFNKSIATELEKRLPRTVMSSTLHSCALSSLLKSKRFDFTLSNSKNFYLAKEKLDFKGINSKKIPGLIMKACRLYDLMRCNLVTGDLTEVIELGDRYGEYPDEEVAKRAIELQNLNFKISDNYFVNGGGKLQIDFADMLHLAVRYLAKEEMKQYNVVFCDETQDFSLLQYEFIKKLKTPRGRLVAVGDDKQSIYSFQGANLDSLNEIKTSPNTVVLPLSMTYRCSEAVVNEACKVFPDGIVASPYAAKGNVFEGKIDMAKEGDFVLCRNNAPLVDAFISLVKTGKRCSILGKEYGDELVSIIDSVNDIWELENVLANLENKLANKGVNNPKNSDIYVKMDEKINVLISLYEYFGSLQKVHSIIYDIFVENPGIGITLSTIHKSKGLEANRVFFLEPGLIPSKYATTSLALYAEKCLRFVAITRAKHELIYC